MNLNFLAYDHHAAEVAAMLTLSHGKTLSYLQSDSQLFVLSTAGMRKSFLKLFPTPK